MNGSCDMLDSANELNLLAIDCTTPYSNIAVISGNRVLFEQSSLEYASHSVNLLADIDSALSRCRLKLQDIGLMGVTTGPGSFTGIRIGLSTINSISFSLGIPAVGIDALSALAHNCDFYEGFVFAAMDARKKEIYGALYRAGRRRLNEIIPAFVLTPSTAAKIVCSKCGDSEVLCVGDAFFKYRALFAGSGIFTIPEEDIHRVMAFRIGFLARERYEDGMKYKYVQPFYVRRSEAELKFSS